MRADAPIKGANHEAESSGIMLFECFRNVGCNLKVRLRDAIQGFNGWSVGTGVASDAFHGERIRCQCENGWSPTRPTTKGGRWRRKCLLADFPDALLGRRKINKVGTIPAAAITGNGEYHGVPHLEGSDVVFINGQLTIRSIRHHKDTRIGNTLNRSNKDAHLLCIFF